MKKILYLLPVLFLLSGCSKPADNGGKPSDEPTPEPTPEYVESSYEASAEALDDAETVPPSEPEKKRRPYVSILGDSISTFKGMVTGDSYPCHYPRLSISSPSQMWWYKIIYERLDGHLAHNESYSGSMIIENSGRSDFIHRFIDHDGLGEKVDIVMIHGGTNEALSEYTYKAGKDLATDIKIDSEEAVPEALMAGYFAAADACFAVSEGSEADAGSVREAIEALPGSTYCEAYIKLLSLIKERYPEAKVVCIIGDWFYPGMQSAVYSIAEHFGAKVVDLLAVNGFNGCTTDPSWNPMPKHDDYCHPGAEAMSFIADKIWSELGD